MLGGKKIGVKEKDAEGQLLGVVELLEIRISQGRRRRVRKAVE